MQFLARLGLNALHMKMLIAALTTWAPVWIIGTSQFEWLGYYWYQHKLPVFWLWLVIPPLCVPLLALLWQWALSGGKPGMQLNQRLVGEMRSDQDTIIKALSAKWTEFQKVFHFHSLADPIDAFAVPAICGHAGTRSLDNASDARTSLDFHCGS